MPRWLEWRTPTIPMPMSRALAIARSMARAAITWPNPLWPSTSETPGVSTRVRRGARDDAPVLQHLAVAAQTAHPLALAGVTAQLALQPGVGLDCCLLRCRPVGKQDRFGLPAQVHRRDADRLDPGAVTPGPREFGQRAFHADDRLRQHVDRLQERHAHVVAPVLAKAGAGEDQHPSSRKREESSRAGMPAAVVLTQM